MTKKLELTMACGLYDRMLISIAGTCGRTASL